MDNVFWLIVESQKERNCFFVTSPYLSIEKDHYNAKFIYSTKEQFDGGNITKNDKSLRWFKVIHKTINDKKRTLPYKDVQSIAFKYGFKKGSGIFPLLNKIPKKSITEIKYPPKIEEVYDIGDNHLCLPEILDFYSIDKSELKLTGSAGLFREEIRLLNDLDIIIPIKNENQLIQLSNKLIPTEERAVQFQDRTWPIRWKNKNGLIICPFYIFCGLDIPILEVKKTEKKIKGNVTITEDIYGIMNIPVFQCKGVCQFLLINSSFIRGFIKNGMTLNINCNIYDITAGKWKGNEVAVIVMDPIYLDEKKLISIC